MTTTTGSRQYQQGEDRSAEGRAKIVCQTLGGNRNRICNAPTEIVGPGVVHGNQAVIYQCQRYAEHRFAVWGGKDAASAKRVADIPRGKAEWGGIGF